MYEKDNAMPFSKRPEELCVDDDAPPSNAIVVVLNWKDLLRRRVLVDCLPCLRCVPWWNLAICQEWSDIRI